MIYYKYNDEMYYIEAQHIDSIKRDEEGNLILDNLTDIRPPDGLYRAKFTGTEWVETGEPSVPDIETIKDEYIINTHSMLDNTLKTPMEWEGKSYTITKEKQLLLAALISLNPTHVEWNATGEESVVWTHKALIALAKAIYKFVKPFVKAQQKAELGIKNAESIDDINKVMDEYKITIGEVTC